MRYTIDKKAMHPRDLACLMQEQRQRRIERQRSDSNSNPHRVYDACNGVAGYDHGVRDPQEPSYSAIKYDRVTKRWVAVTEYTVTQPSNSDPFAGKVARQVRHGARQENRQRGGNF